MAQQADKEDQKAEEIIIFQLGTNPWQMKNEAAPGSGILHQAHHNAYNRMDNVTCFSIYPSGQGIQTTELYQSQFPDKTDPRRDLVRIYALKDDIPICESNSPTSHRRWHGMSAAERAEFWNGAVDMVEQFLDDIETKYKPNKKIDLIIVHHTFMNPIMMYHILEKRDKLGKYIPPVAVFIHGTAIKMYKHELREEKENIINGEFLLKETPVSGVSKKNYKRFLDWVSGDLKLFNGDGKYKPCVGYAISSKSYEAFQEVFKDFPTENILLSPNGIDTKIMYPIKDINVNDILKELKTFPADANEKSVALPLKSPTGVDWDKLIVHVSKLADWKRPDSVLYAIAQLKDKYPNAVTIIAGQGSHQQNVKFQNLSKELGISDRVFFIGQQMLPQLARIYTVSDIGVFPSKDEPFGMVFIECMMCSTPVIGCNSGGPKDFMEKNENDKYLTGILIDETDDHKELGTRIANQIDIALKEDWKKTKRDACLKLASGYTVDAQVENILKDTWKLLGK